MTSSVLLGSLLLPMGISWGFERSDAALIQSIMALVGILGSVLFGFVADKLGGGRSLALIGFNCAVLWAILLMHPPFAVTAIVVGLIGMHGAGAIPRSEEHTYELQSLMSRSYAVFCLKTKK